MNAHALMVQKARQKNDKIRPKTKSYTSTFQYTNILEMKDSKSTQPFHILRNDCSTVIPTIIFTFEEFNDLYTGLEALESRQEALDFLLVVFNLFKVNGTCVWVTLVAAEALRVNPDGRREVDEVDEEERGETGGRGRRGGRERWREEKGKKKG